MKICSVKSHYVSASTSLLSNHFYFIFLFCGAAVKAVSLVRPVPLFVPIAVLFVIEQMKIDR